MGSDKIEFYPHGMLKVCCNNRFLDKDLNLEVDRITAEAIKQKRKLKRSAEGGNGNMIYLSQHNIKNDTIQKLSMYIFGEI